MADTPARHVYTGNGNIRVFPIPTRIIGDDYVRIEIDGIHLIDRTQWDIVNNSVIFLTAPINGSEINIQVATSEEALSVLGSVTNVDIVATNMTDVNTVANNIEEVQSAYDNAVIATTKANEASISASAAATSASTASTKATEASASASSASASASTAVTKANEASASASTATTKASEASASATSASTSASQALTSRNQAETFAQQAQASASSVDANNIVHRSGDESIVGVKTFSSSPIVPTPIDGTQAVNKDYVDKKTNTFENIAQLKLNSNISRVDVLGYYTKGDGGGGLFYWDSASTETDNGGTIIQATGITTGRWKRVFSGNLNIKWFGAKCDNIQDDTDYINKALSLGGGITFPKGTYKITNSLNYTGTKSIFIDGGGATLNCVSSEMGTVLYISPSEEIDFCLVKNLKINGNSIAKYGIQVHTGVNRITDIRIDDNVIADLDNVSTVSSTCGIAVYANNNSTLDITSNFIFNINRTQVNSGVIASVGIGVYGLETVANISNNVINGVSSPAGDADADGIQVFSKNRLDSNVRQSAMPSISNNRIQQVKGRFVKLQSSNGKVYSNYMSNVGIELIDNFRGVDAQTGGVDIFDNTIRIGTFTGGNSLSLFLLQMQSTGNNENAYTVKNNQITLEKNIPYGCLLHPAINSNATVLIDGNIIQDKTNTFICSTFVEAGVAESMSNYMIKISNNIIPIGIGGRLFRFSGITLGLLTNATTGTLISNILKLHITDNIASSTGADTDLIYFEPSGENYPYLQYLTILGNSNFTRNQVVCKGMDIKKLPEGTSFYYSTDGTASGGLVNAPAGYNRYVTVETPSKTCARLWDNNNSSYVAYNHISGTTFKYTGVTV